MVGLQNLANDSGLPQRRFLLGLSSGLLDVMPSPGIAFARPPPSDHAINDIINDIYCFLPLYQRHLIERISGLDSV